MCEEWRPVEELNSLNSLQSISNKRNQIRSIRDSTSTNKSQGQERGVKTTVLICVRRMKNAVHFALAGGGVRYQSKDMCRGAVSLQNQHRPL